MSPAEAQRYVILCAYDGSAAADRAFQFAVSLGTCLKGVVHTLAVVQPIEGPSELDDKSLFESGNTHFTPKFERLRRLYGTEIGVEARFEVCVGYPPHKIVHRAGELGADHIVLGHQGRTAMQRWELGSVAQRVVMHASTLVTVVP